MRSHPTIDHRCTTMSGAASRWIAALGVLCLLAASSAPAVETFVGRQLVDQYPITSWNQMTYGLTWRPPSYANTTTKYPLIIFLHGSGEGGDGVAGLSNLITTALPMKIANGWNPQAVNPVDGKTYEFLVVSPQAPAASKWSYTYGHVLWILADVMNRYRVDPSRIYITGLSAGGAGTWSSVTNDPAFTQKIAAILPVSAVGVNSPSEDPNIPFITGTWGVKVWTICGLNDAWLSTANAYVGRINAASPAPGVPAVVTGLPGVGHEPAAWNTAYEPSWRSNAFGLNAYEWLLKSARSTGAPNAAPTISAIADRTIAAGGTTGALPFTVADAETAATALSVTATSSNVALVPAAGVVLGGSGASRTVGVTAASAQSGVATITVAVSDGASSTSTAFTVTVTAPTPPPTAPASTILVDFGPASSATTGNWNNVWGYSAAPGVANAVDSLGDPTGVGIAITRSFVWADASGVASSALYPQTAQQGWVASNVYASGAVTISRLNPAALYDLVFFGSVAANPWVARYTVGSASTTLNARDNTSQTTALANLSPAADGTLVVSVTEESGGAGVLNAMEIRAHGTSANTAPTITAIGNQTLAVGGSTGALAVTVGDAQTAAGSLTLSASSSNTALVPISRIVLGGSGAARTVTVAAAAGQSGTATITVAVSDGSLTASTAFQITVAAPAAANDYTLLVDFGPASVATPGNWNNVTGYSAAPGIVNAIDSLGAPTGVGIAITKNFVWAADGGVASSALYPQTAQRGWVASDTTTTGLITLSRLNPAKSYDLVFFASSIGGAWVCRYTVGAATTTLNALNNTDQTATLANLVPAADGTLVISVTAATGSTTGCLNVLEVRAHAPAPAMLSGVGMLPSRAASKTGRERG